VALDECGRPEELFQDREFPWAMHQLWEFIGETAMAAGRPSVARQARPARPRQASRAVEFPDHSFRGRQIHVTSDQYLTGCYVNLEPHHPRQIPQSATERAQAVAAQAPGEHEDVVVADGCHGSTVTRPPVHSLSIGRR
jgi:hypothetical protein